MAGETGPRPHWLYRHTVGAFAEKRGDGFDWGSMTRWVAWLFAIPCACRILVEGVSSWPFAFVCFFVLFSIGFSKALDRAPPETVVRAVTGMFGRRERPPRENPEAYGGPSPGYMPPAFTDASPDYPSEDEEP